MFPSFDEPAFKATFALSAIIDDGDHAISNGAVISDTPGPRAGKHTVRFDTSPKMSTYLVALAVGDFECIEGAADGTPIRVCSTPDKKGLLGVRARIGAADPSLLQPLLRGEVPLQEARRRRRAGLRGGRDGERRRDLLSRVVPARGSEERVDVGRRRPWRVGARARDGAPVVRRPRHDAVVGRHLAERGVRELDGIEADRGVEARVGHRRSATCSRTRARWGSMRCAPRGRSARRHRRPPRSTSCSTGSRTRKARPSSGWSNSGSARRPSGKGVNAYIEKFKYGNARAEDFWSTVAHTADKPVDQVMKSFVDQPGVPIVNVRVNCSGDTGSVVVTQERYVRDASTPADPQVWSIPVCIKTPSGKTRCTVVSDDDSDDSCSIRVPPGCCPTREPAATTAWAFRRRCSAHSRRTWRRWRRPSGLRFSTTSGRSCARDATTSDSFLDLAGGFKAERNAAVLETLTGTLAFIERAVASGPSRPTFRDSVSKLLKPALQDVGWTPRAGESEDVSSARATVIGTIGRVARDPEVLAKARELAAREIAAAWILAARARQASSSIWRPSTATRRFTTSTWSGAALRPIRRRSTAT